MSGGGKGAEKSALSVVVEKVEERMFFEEKGKYADRKTANSVLP